MNGLLQRHAHTLDADALSLLGSLCTAETGAEMQEALDAYDDMWENYTIIPGDSDYEPID